MVRLSTIQEWEKKMKKKIALVFSFALACVLAFVLAGCGSGSSSTTYKIAVPSDTTNEARALLLLEDQGLIKLREGAGLTATKNDIVENPYNIEIIEVEAASLPRTLPDVDFAVINGNYALSSGIDPSTAIVGEDPEGDAAVEYANLVAFRAEDTGSEKARVLIDVLQSDEVQKYITETYSGAVIPVNIPAMIVGDGVVIEEKVIKVGASPAPHAEILEFAKPLIQAKGYKLEITEFTDYVQPNVALSDGLIDANFFQHFPYLEDYNAENKTTLASVGKVHFEPLCIYPGKLSSLSDIK